MSFNPAALFGNFRYNQGPITLVPGGVGNIVKCNPLRVALLMSVASGNQATLQPGPGPTVGSGYSLNTNSGSLNLTFANHGALVGQEWNYTSTSGGTLYFIEVIWVDRED